MKRFFPCLMVLMALVLVGCHRTSKFESLRDQPLPAEIEVVSEGTGVVTNVYVGEILAKADIPLVFPLGGQLTSIQVKSGQHVREGQVIATVDNTQAKAMLERAEAMLGQAEDAWRRLKPVHENGGLSDVKWVEMETNLSKARSMVLSSRKRYDDCTLRASQAGVANLYDIEVGQHLNVGQPIGSLLDMTGKRASFTVPESEIGHLMHGVGHGVVDVEQGHGVLRDAGSDVLRQSTVDVNLASHGDAATSETTVDVAGHEAEHRLEGGPALVGHSHKLAATLVSFNPVGQCQLILGELR